MKDPRDIILRPIISEKTYALMDKGTYTFEVDPLASKPEISDAVESIWNVKVRSVNTLNRRGKVRSVNTLNRRGKVRQTRGTNRFGRRADSKRAIVTLEAGNEIPLFEN